jgi:transcriptional regulator with XRE-family HTH domain
MTKQTALPAARRRARQKRYDPVPLRTRLQQLLKTRNESYREAALRAGLDHQAVRRILSVGQRPAIQTCILLADHFDLNPNEFLELAGHPALKIFEAKIASTKRLPPEAIEVAIDLAQIPNLGTRKAVAQAIRVLLKQYFELS